MLVQRERMARIFDVENLQKSLIVSNSHDGLKPCGKQAEA